MTTRTKRLLTPQDALPLMLTGIGTAGAQPEGFQPLGDDADCPGCDPTQIPTSIDQLGELVSYSYDLSVRRAGELNIPVVGTISGGFDRRVVVYEWTRYREIPGERGIRCRYGFVIRFCVTISNWDAQARVSLPFLSAQAELGNIQASWLMQVRGLVGPQIDGVVLPPRELKVETFILAIQSLEKVIEAISDPTTRFISGILLTRIDPHAPEVVYWRAAVRAFAMDAIRRGRSRAQAVARLGSADAADHDLVGEAYEYVGITDPQAEPAGGARSQAERVLRGIRVDR